MKFIVGLGLAALTATAQAAIKGMNTGSTFMNGQAKQQADFAYEFRRAQQLPGASGWNSARLYTMVQSGTASDPISAIPAAIETGTGLLLGLWASAGDAAFGNELQALKNAIRQYGSSFAAVVQGISVGSEDLYRISPTGIGNKSGPGANPSVLVGYIRRVREAISGTSLAGKPVGHVDTWNALTNGSNSAVIANSDFVGMDAYPYFQNSMANSINDARQLFYDALGQTRAAAQGKPVWVTETGWPVIGKTENQAVANTQNARRYWQDVACSLTAQGVNTYWYMLQESQYGQADPEFGLYGPGDLFTLKPYYDLSC